MFKDSLNTIRSIIVRLSPTEEWLCSKIKKNYEGRLELITMGGEKVGSYSFGKKKDVALNSKIATILPITGKQIEMVGSGMYEICTNYTVFTPVERTLVVRCPCEQHGVEDYEWCKCYEKPVYSRRTVVEQTTEKECTSISTGNDGEISFKAPQNYDDGTNYYPLDVAQTQCAMPEGGPDEYWFLNCENKFINIPQGKPLPIIPVWSDDENHFLQNNPDIEAAIDAYLNENNYSSEANDFAKWAVGYLRENPSVTVTQFENFLQSVQDSDYRPRDKAPLSYPWKENLRSNGNDWEKVFKTFAPLFLPNGNYNPDAFNCHYYAFGAESATSTLASEGSPKWVTAIRLVGWEKVTGNIKVGDRVMYFSANSNVTDKEWLHSGIVVEVDNEGYATKISSKMSSYEIIEHHPRDIPEEYGSSEPTFTIRGKEYPSRIYWRKK